MNKVRQLFALISDEDLQLGLEEIFEAERSQSFPENGIINRYNTEYCKLVGNNKPINLTAVTVGFMRQASVRWYRDQKI